MEDLTPTLLLVLSVRESLERGDSVRTGIAEFIETDRGDLKILLLAKSLESATQALRRPLKETERAVFAVLQRGLAGESILPNLRDLETELIEKSEDEMEEFTQKLGLRSLIPLLLLVFPGYLLLLLGPTFERLLISLE